MIKLLVVAFCGLDCKADSNVKLSMVSKMSWQWNLIVLLIL